MDTEQLAVGNLITKISACDRLKADIPVGDKAPSFDGNIIVYPKPGYRKDEGVIYVPVQVKGRVMHRPGGKVKYFPVETGDLKSYDARGGVLFFEVCCDEKGESLSYYCGALLRGDVKKLLDEAGGQKTKSVKLPAFDTERDKLQSMVETFAGAMIDQQDGTPRRWEEYSREQIIKQFETPPKPEHESYIGLYTYHSNAVGFYGREEQVEELNRFISSGGAFRWWGAAAPGGSGKTRLGYEFCNMLNEGGDWTAEFVGINGLHDLPPLSNDELNSRYPNPTLLVVDYVQQFSKEIGEWLTRLCAEDFRRDEASPLRMLLLERAPEHDEGGELAWERDIYRSGLEHLIRRKRYAPVMRLPQLGNAAMKAIIKDFAGALRMREAGLPRVGDETAGKLLEELRNVGEGYFRPLFAMLLTDARLHGKTEGAWTAEKLLDYHVEREIDHVRANLPASLRGKDRLAEALLNVWRTATVIGSTGDASLETLSRLRGDCMEIIDEWAAKEGREREDLLSQANLLDSSFSSVPAMRPDIMGEYFLIHWLRGPRTKQEAAERFLSAVLREYEAAKVFYFRLLNDFGGAVMGDEALLGKLFPKRPALESECEKPYARLLRELFNGVEQEDAGGKRVAVLGADIRRFLCGTLCAYAEGRGKGTEEDADVLEYAALASGDMGDHAKALKLHEKTLAIRKKAFGPVNPSTAATYNNIANVYKEQGNYAKALEFHKKALAIKEKTLGPEHPDTAGTYNNIANVYDDRGDHAKALEFHEKALAIREKALGPVHPDTAMTYNNIAIVYRKQGKYAKALEFNYKALAIREKALGPGHPDTAMTYNNIALVYYNQGDHAKALEFHEKALAIYEKALGPVHPLTAMTYNNIAVVYKEQGKYAKALEFYDKALEIREKALGPVHPLTATTYHNIANVYNKQGDHAKALEFYYKALAIYEKALGTEHPDTAMTYNNIAVVYKNQGDHAKALELYEKALAIKEKALGTEHPDTAMTYYNIGALYWSKREPEKALPWFMKALAVYEKKLRDEHPYTLAVRRVVGIVRDALKNAQE